MKKCVYLRGYSIFWPYTYCVRLRHSPLGQVLFTPSYYTIPLPLIHSPVTPFLSTCFSLLLHHSSLTISVSCYIIPLLLFQSPVTLFFLFQSAADFAQEFSCSVRDVERITGLRFFPALSFQERTRIALTASPPQTRVGQRESDDCSNGLPVLKL